MPLKEPPDFESKVQPALNINSAISLGLLVPIIGGIFWIKDGQRTSEIGRIQDTADNAKNVAELKVEIANLQRDMGDKTRDRLTTSQFFHWAVQLQRVNNEAGIRLIVPDPGKDQ